MAVAEREEGRWASIARKDALVKVDEPLLKSTAGLKTVVVDANALIGGGVRLPGIADQFVTVTEVLAEVRDPASRFHLATLPVTIRCLEPSSEALAAVTKFSRVTGDFQSLSSVDLKLLALTYTIEAEVHGTANIRSTPPPLLVTHSNTREKNPPGWGAVENPEEWDGIEDNALPGAGETKSHILGLKSLNLQPSESDVGLNVPPTTVSNGGKDAEVVDSRELGLPESLSEGLGVSERAEESAFSIQEDSQPLPTHEGHSTVKDEVPHTHLQKDRKAKPKAPEKETVDLEGKLNVAEGLDASKGEIDHGDDNWQRASSRTTRRKYLKREAKRSARRQAAENASAELPYTVGDDEQASSDAANVPDRGTDDVHATNSGATNVDDIGTGDPHPVNSSSFPDIDEVGEDIGSEEDLGASYDEDEVGESRALDGRDMVDDSASNCTDAPSLQSGVVESEESWMLGPMWKSSIACMTADFAMQNVLLQMGLRLLSTNGIHIRELNKWVLKCQACNHVVTDVGRLFCPKCGNGGTLSKVAVTVGQNGIVHAGRPRRINLRGTRYSLPMPKGGREGAAQNPILREDQLPKVKKTGELDRSILSDVNFTTSRAKKAQNLASVQKAAAVLSGRRNPNERRAARS